jgi:hypothetical protein
LYGTGVLVVLGPSLLFLAYLEFNQTIDEPEARAYVAGLAGGAGNLPGSLRIVKAIRDPGFGDEVRWYKLSVSPAEVDAFKGSVRREMERRAPADVSDADDPQALAESGAPGWWRPRDLPDPDLLRGRFSTFVFSPQTGTVYVEEVSP